MANRLSPGNLDKYFINLVRTVYLIDRTFRWNHFYNEEFTFRYGKVSQLI